MAPRATSDRSPVRVAGREKDKGHPRRPALNPIITMNAEGIIQSASDGVERIFGWTPTELFGRNVKVLIPEPPRSALDRYLDRYRHADRAKTLTRTGRFDAVRKDGRVVPIEMSISRADLPVQSAPYFIGIIRDVGEEIDVGDTVTERTRLQRLVAEQSRALATANLRLHLADRLASLGTLAAGLGHDMNNVLLPLRARLNAIEHAGITAPARGHVDAVRRSIAYLQHLSDALHFLALDPDGPGAVRDGKGFTDLVPWWTQVGSLLKKAVPRHVKVRASFPARLPPVSIAPHWLTQAALNLIVNAGESMPPGRRAARVRVWAKVTDGGRTVTLGVTDNGRGMSQSIQRRAFDLFFTTKPRSMGTGLGLPLARKVAIRAGGNLEIRSEPGVGTTATLILPTSPIASTSRAAPPRLTAVVSVRSHRTAALVSQVLLGVGIMVRRASASGPRAANVWVTEPTPAALRRAIRWKGAHPERVVALMGEPAMAHRAAWATLNPTIIDPPDDFEAIRHALGRVAMGEPKIQTRSPNEASKRKRARG